MAGYGLKSFLIAQSPQPDRESLWREQLDPRQLPCPRQLRDQRRAHRQARSDALGTATEMKAMKNYAGHRLSPWLGHLMVSRSETARRCSRPAR
jgi:type IV secretion system protein VirD4